MPVRFLRDHAAADHAAGDQPDNLHLAHGVPRHEVQSFDVHRGVEVGLEQDDGGRDLQIQADATAPGLHDQKGNIRVERSKSSLALVETPRVII